MLKGLNFCGPIMLVIITFLLQPFLSFLLLLFIGLTKKKITSKFIFLVSLVGSCYLGLINTTKLPESDLLNYIDWYASAQESSVQEYILLNSREPLYFIGLYGIANSPVSSEKFFIFLSTVLSYYIFLYAIVKLSICVKLNFKSPVGLVILFILFAPMVSLSAHFMRQFLAGSLVVLFFSEYVTTNKKKWLILLFAILIHYSSILFVPIALARKIGKFSIGISLILNLAFLPVAYVLSKYAAPIFNDFPILGLVFNRVAAEDGAELGSLSAVAVVFSMFIIIIAIANIRALYRSGGNNAVWCINVAVLVIGLTSVVANTQPQLTEIATRFFFYLYFLSGLVLPIHLSFRKNSVGILTMALIIVIPFFVYKLAYGEWTYSPLIDLAIAPSWVLWSHL